MMTRLLVVLFLPVYAAAPISDVSTGEQGDTAIHEHNAHVDGPGIEEDEEPPVPIMPIIEEDEEPPVPIVPIMPECEADQKISGSNCMCNDGICEEGSTCVEGKTCTPECEADQKISGSNCMCDDGICEEGSTCVEGKTCTLGKNNWLTRVGRVYSEKLYSFMLVECNCLTSPEYPNNYPDNANLKLSFSVASGQPIEVTFLDFDLEFGHKICPFDYLEFSDENGNIVGEKLCGNKLPAKFTIQTSTASVFFHSDYSVTEKGFKFCYTPAPTCRGGATKLSTSPGHDMVLCKDNTRSTCEADFETLCPAGWNLCTPGQFNNRNDGWDYNWKDAYAGHLVTSPNDAGNPLGVIYCYDYYGVGEAAHYGIDNAVLNTDQHLHCRWSSSRPGCEYFAGTGGHDCNNNASSALCCAPTRTCGDGVVQQEEDCDDGNSSNMDFCLNSCTWKHPGKHGFSEWCY